MSYLDDRRVACTTCAAPIGGPCMHDSRAVEWTHLARNLAADPPAKPSQRPGGRR